MPYRKLLSTMLVGALAIGLSTTTALAQENQADQSVKPVNKMQQHDMKTMQKGKMDMRREHRMDHAGQLQGRHMMVATVTSLDKTSGIVEVNAEGMDLRVHFPPASLTDVNKGDKITLMLGFHKGDVKAAQQERMMKRKDMMMERKSMIEKDSVKPEPVDLDQK